MSIRGALSFLVVLLLMLSDAIAQTTQPVFLRRSASEVQPRADDLSAEKSRYQPHFGIGDADAKVVQGIARFGELTIDPGGSSRIVSYENEEQAYYVVAGSGTLHYGEQKLAIKANDFMYLPVGVGHGLSNSSNQPLKVLVMGYHIPASTVAPKPEKPMLASADEVPLQILGQHGPTTQFKLLMGNTRSARDKLAASSQITSLFMMDFDAGGTNIPHTHAREEEIYYILRGHGEMVAGRTPDGGEARHPAKQGDVFYFPPNTLIGFYSGNKPNEPHALIIAVRSPWQARSSN